MLSGNYAENSDIALRISRCLLLLLKLDNHHLNRLLAGVDVGVERVGRICRQPVRLARLPDVRLDVPVRCDDVHRAASERDDDARIFSGTSAWLLILFLSVFIRLIRVSHLPFTGYTPR